MARFGRREGFRPASSTDGPWNLLGSPVPRSIARPTRAFVLAQQTDGLLLAVGSTLQVFPAASVVPVAKEAGARIVIANNQPTAMDPLADALLRGPLGDVLPAICAADP